MEICFAYLPAKPSQQDRRSHEEESQAPRSPHCPATQGGLPTVNAVTGMTISLDDLSRKAGERYEHERRQREAKQAETGGDPFKRPRGQPGRARRRPATRPSVSLRDNS